MMMMMIFWRTLAIKVKHYNYICDYNRKILTLQLKMIEMQNVRN